MTVPNAERAVVPIEKLTDYLLSVSHPVGGTKARFFLAHGFSKRKAGALADGLKGIARREATSVRETPFGVKYAVEGPLATPRGTTVQIETVWIIEPHDDRPRLVTAYPVRVNRPQTP